LLWEKREQYDLVLLIRPSARNKKRFKSYEQMAGIESFPGPGVATGKGLKIVWGDALNRGDLEEACRGIDWCLHTMALISPAADRDPEMAMKVNAGATARLVEIIEAADPERIRMVQIGSVAEYGDRLPPVHVGRTGDPILPSVFDRYALSKIGAELAVMESRIRHRVSLRQTFIMIPDLFSLIDPIMFHQPLHSMMENISARDAGRVLVRCLEIPGDSDFWGGYYNISGGPGCRITFLEFLDRIYRMLGIDYHRVMERNWFALKNFHMQFFEDANRLDSYLHHWEGGQQMEDYFSEVWEKLPWYLKVTAWLTKRIPPFRWIVEGGTRLQLRTLSQKEGGTMHWIKHRKSEWVGAFFGSCKAWEEIPGWDHPLPDLDLSQNYRRLDHGYDESKAQLELGDLQQVARFRGGSLLSASWDGEPDQKLQWQCCQGHRFEMTPRSVLRGGHWCLECIAPPWNYGPLKEKNPFAAQVLGVVIEG
jgi:nucleoside-diphosphate-sugar epimerase